MDPSVVIEVPSAEDWVARGVAVVAAGAAIASLGWQVIEWKLGGGRVKVEPAHFGIAATDPVSTEIIGFRARNVGRSTATVEAWGFETAAGKAIVFPRQPPDWNNPTMPHELPPGHSAVWTIPMDWVRQVLLNEAMDNVELRPHVRLGTGKDVRAKETFALPGFGPGSS